MNANDLIIRPLEQRDLAEAAAIEAAAPDAWSENALRTSLQAQREGGAARLFAAVRAAGEAGSERQGGCPSCRQRQRTTEGLPPVSAGQKNRPSVLGVAAFQYAGGAASLDTLAVALDFRRRGVGRALLKAALAQLCAEGAGLCFLEVRQSNAPAIALYQSLGFAAVGRRRGFYRDPAEDAIVMRCALPETLG